MKQKFPLLEQLRSERLMRENEIAKPYKDDLKLMTEVAASLKRRLRAIEETMASDMAKNIPDIIANELSHKLMHTVMEAAAKSHKPNSFIVELPKHIAFGHPSSLEAEAVRLYKNNCLPKLSLNVSEMTHDFMTIIDVRIPELGFRYAINK